MDEDTSENRDLMNVLQGNFDEMNSLRKELGDDMDELYKSIMGDLSAPKSIEEQVNDLLVRINKLDKALDGHLSKVGAMEAGSPKRHAIGFEEIITEMRDRLSDLQRKCGMIPGSPLPLFQVKVIDEELTSIEKDASGLPKEMVQTFARRLSFQVSLSAVASSTERILAERDRRALALTSLKSDREGDSESENENENENLTQEKKESQIECTADTFRLAAERQGMLKAEKEQRSYGDNFFGVLILAERQRMLKAEKEQRARGDAFFGLDVAERELERVAEQRLQEINQYLEEQKRLRELDNMRDAEASQLENGNDSFWGIDAEREEKEKENEAKLIQQMREVLDFRHDDDPVEKIEDSYVFAELNAMRIEEKAQLSSGDRFWGLDRARHDAQKKIAQLHRGYLLRKRAKAGKVLFDKGLAWEAMEKQQIEKQRNELRRVEALERQAYMKRFLSVPALPEQGRRHIGADISASMSSHLQSPNRQILMPMPATLKPASPPVFAGELQERDHKPDSIKWWDDASGTMRKSYRSDSLPSLADPRRSGTFAEDRARVSKIRSQIESIHLVRQFSSLKLPKVGRSDSERRRRRKMRRHGDRGNGPQWFAERSESRTLRQKFRELRWKDSTMKNYQEESASIRKKKVKRMKKHREKIKAEARERKKMKQMRQWEEAKALRKVRRRKLTKNQPSEVDNHVSLFIDKEDFTGPRDFEDSSAEIKVVNGSLDWIYSPSIDQNHPQPPHLVHNSGKLSTASTTVETPELPNAWTMSIYQQDRFRL